MRSSSGRPEWPAVALPESDPLAQGSGYTDGMLTYPAAASELHTLLERWWVNPDTGAADSPPRRHRRSARGQRGRVSLAQPRSSEASQPTESTPWWQPSERQNLLQQLAAAADRGEHAALLSSEECSPMATAALIVHGLLTSSRQGTVTHAESLACVSALTSLCACRPDDVVAACGGRLESWAIERLDALHGANTERAAHLELLLLELLARVATTHDGRRHLHALPLAQKVLTRLRSTKSPHEQRATALLQALAMGRDGR